MKNFKKVLSIMIATILVMTSLAACGKKDDTATSGNPTSGAKTTQAPAKKVTLKTVSMMGGTDANGPKYQDVIKQFQTDNPNVTIEDESQVSDQDWKTKIAADFAVGNEPDVIQYFTDANASDVLKADKFVDIATIKAEYPDYAKDTKEDFLKLAANPDGVQRAVPTTGYWEGLFCNKDLFDKYGLELPTDWDKLTKAINTFKSKGIVPIAASLNEVPHYWVEFLMLSAAGPDGYSQVPTSAPADWVTGLTYFKTLRDAGAFPVDTDTVKDADTNTLFFNKKAAMHLDGSWFLGQVKDQDNTVLVPFPNVTGAKAQPGFMVGGVSSGFYITKKAWDDPDKREAAVKFVEANTSAAQVQIYWNGAGSPATAVTTPDTLTPLAKSGADYASKAVTVSSPTDSRISAAAYTSIIKGIVGVSTGKTKPEKLLNDAIALNK
jgi:ABC-type sugar transport system, periplasmic component